jgi:hypothetical protein
MTVKPGKIRIVRGCAPSGLVYHETLKYTRVVGLDLKKMIHE